MRFQLTDAIEKLIAVLQKYMPFPYQLKSGHL